VTVAVSAAVDGQRGVVGDLDPLDCRPGVGAAADEGERDGGEDAGGQ
jgi:hypothetical protein